jgi:hypothetical protein
MAAEKTKIEMKWAKDLAQPAGNDRYAFYATLSPRPPADWVRCFREIAALFKQSLPFEADIQNTQTTSHAVIYGPLRAFEIKLSAELQEAVSQTNDAYNRFVEQQLIQRERNAVEQAADEKILEDLKKKFVKE